MRRSNLLHSRERFEAALRLASFGGFRTEAIDESPHVCDFALLFLIGRLLSCEAFRANPLKGAVVTGVEFGALLLKTQDVSADAIKKITIMGDQQ